MLCSNDSERKMAEWKKITVSDIADTHKNDMSTVFLMQYTGFISRTHTVNIKCTGWF